MSVPVVVLAAMPLFAQCRSDDLAALAGRMRFRSAPAGETVMYEGDNASEFALLLVGAADVIRNHELMTVARPGAIIGELALLRGAPRTATVTTTEPSDFAVGDESDLEFLLHLPGVHDAMRDLASARLAQDVDPVSTTVGRGWRVLLRPLLPSDRAEYTAAIEHMSIESLRHRFFSAGQPSEKLVEYLLHVDYVDHFVWLALLDAGDAPIGIGAGRYIRSSTGAGDAEVAFGIVDEYQGVGIGRLLVGAVGVAARAAGISRLTADVMADNEPMRALFRTAGGKFSFGEPGIVHCVLTADGAADLVSVSLQRDLAAASHDVVTAAGLALT